MNPPHLLQHFAGAPLLERIKATDELIDATVYSLHGLSEEETKIEESISGEKNAEIIKRDY